jgi:ArsR family transcriptional regulator, virulence genes transcriptional regulator
MGKQSIIVFNDVENGELHSAGILLRAISHPLRLKILSFIDKHKPVNVHSIYTNLNLDQSIASQQLNILRASNLVKTTREGKFIFYTVNYETIERINMLIDNFKK